MAGSRGGRTARPALLHARVPTLENERAIPGALEAAGVAGVSSGARDLGTRVRDRASPCLHCGRRRGASFSSERYAARDEAGAVCLSASPRSHMPPWRKPLAVVHGDVSPDNAYVAEDPTPSSPPRARPVGAEEARMAARCLAELYAAPGRQGLDARGRLRPRGLGPRHGDPLRAVRATGGLPRLRGCCGGSPARRAGIPALARAVLLPSSTLSSFDPRDTRETPRRAVARARLHRTCTRKGLDTQTRRSPIHGAVMTPIVLSSTFAQDGPAVLKGPGFDYSRAGNPTRDALERPSPLGTASRSGADDAILLLLKRWRSRPRRRRRLRRDVPDLRQGDEAVRDRRDVPRHERRRVRAVPGRRSSSG